MPGGSVLLPPPSTASAVLLPRRSVRIEYLGFENVGESREYRLATYGPEGGTEHRFRIAIAAFGGGGRVRLQDGPDVCYQKLLRAVVAGEVMSTAVITLDEAELASYLQAHTHVPKHRSWTPPANPRPPFVPPPARPRAVPPPPVVVAKPGEPALEEGQRVSHALYGVGVTTSSAGGHTVVRFDGEGSKTFVTSLVELEVLSAPHTWQTSPRGKNKPR
jgi:hypothetical protein